jgi:hypothetical protein
LYGLVPSPPQWFSDLTRCLQVAKG